MGRGGGGCSSDLLPLLCCPIDRSVLHRPYHYLTARPAPPCCRASYWSRTSSQFNTIYFLFQRRAAPGRRRPTLNISRVMLARILGSSVASPSHPFLPYLCTSLRPPLPLSRLTYFNIFPFTPVPFHIPFTISSLGSLSHSFIALRSDLAGLDLFIPVFYRRL